MGRINDGDRPEPPEFIRVSEAARLLDRTASGVHRAIRSGQLPGIKVGGLWVVPKAYIDQLLQQAMAGWES